MIDLGVLADQSSAEAYFTKSVKTVTELARHSSKNTLSYI
jgi:hypothetical protein